VTQEYLLGYGLLGDFGRFRAPEGLTCRRGQRAVIRSHRGLEIGQVLREATPRHAHFLPNTTVGTLLRLATDADECLAHQLRERAATFCEAAAEQAHLLNLPLAVLDAEWLMDSGAAIVHFVRWQDCDLRELVSGLSTAFEIPVLLQDLTRAVAPEAEHAPEHAAEEHGCGDCGSGGCGSCGSGGQGGCGTCGSAKPEEVKAYFSGLREQMLSANRLPLV
jgi:hypothetical protein